MEFKRGNPAFAGYENSYPYNRQPAPTGFAKTPVSHAVSPGPQYLQDPCPPPVPLPPPGADLMATHFPSAQGRRPALVDPTGKIHILPSHPFSTPSRNSPVGSKEDSRIVSPLAHRIGRLTLDHLKRLESENGAGNAGNPSQGPVLIPDAAKSMDTVALPSEMPIGSLVHLQPPPKWGVLKISNIPYSITKLEINQFLGRQARLISPEDGCAVHIIMERPTAKTMDCYVEFQTPNDAKDAVTRINKMHETSRIPRLGNRHIDVELSSQDALLKDLFPRAKCLHWKDGVPYVLENTDPYSTGFTGFFTSEEIVGAIRHAEVPHRFPWYATKLYTVHDRNCLFEMVNRQIKALVARVKKSNTVGLDQRLLRDLLKAGLSCPAFNDRQKYTLCVNSEELSEILKFDMGKWFPFDSLVKMPKHDDRTLMYYAGLISNGPIQNFETVDLPNNFPADTELKSPYGSIWLEWGLEASKRKVWDDAVQQEVYILSSLVLAGWIKNYGDEETAKLPVPTQSDAAISTSGDSENSDATVPPNGAHSSALGQASPYQDSIFATPSRCASDNQVLRRPFFGESASRLNPGLFIRPVTRPQSRPFTHRNTLSSPTCLPSSSDPFFN
ncbi:hypothetical protein MAP00_006602 [Monascus purpureus]|nr:hypothetical protein MAP00_006602 [Monascus purpureus]